MTGVDCALPHLGRDQQARRPTAITSRRRRVHVWQAHRFRGAVRLRRLGFLPEPIHISGLLLHSRSGRRRHRCLPMHLSGANRVIPHARYLIRATRSRRAPRQRRADGPGEGTIPRRRPVQRQAGFPESEMAEARPAGKAAAVDGCVRDAGGGADFHSLRRELPAFLAERSFDRSGVSLSCRTSRARRRGAGRIARRSAAYRQGQGGGPQEGGPPCLVLPPESPPLAIDAFFDLRPIPRTVSGPSIRVATMNKDALGVFFIGAERILRVIVGTARPAPRRCHRDRSAGGPLHAAMIGYGLNIVWRCRSSFRCSRRLSSISPISGLLVRPMTRITRTW